MGTKDLSGIDFAGVDEVGDIVARLKGLSEGEQSIHLLKKMLYNYLTSQFVGWSLDRERNILAFADLLEKQSDNDIYANYIISYVRAFSDGVRSLGGWESGRRVALYSNPDPARAAEIVAQINAGEGAPREIVRGHVASLFDRELAHRHYSAALGQADLVGRFYIDQGINTYFSSPESLPRLVEGLNHKVASIRSSARLSLIFSMDAVFCSAYLPLVIHYARYLPDYNYHFVFVGADNELSACEEMLKGLVDAQERCAGRKLENYSYSTMSIPALVKDKTTLYACARYFAACDLLERFEGVYIMDVDIQLTSNPAGYFASMLEQRLCLSRVLHLGQLMPWRRCMAGNVYVSNSEVGRVFLNVACDYMRAGLLCKGSWTLDQNALCYALEYTGANVLNLNDVGRPTSQPKINKLFEAGVSKWWLGDVAQRGRMRSYLRGFWQALR
jgi:hypothetical protein